MAISNGGQCPQLNSGLGTSHGWLSSMWIERSDTLIHALGYNTTLFAGQSEGWYVLILVPKKLEDFETFNAVLQRGARAAIRPVMPKPSLQLIPSGMVSTMGSSISTISRCPASQAATQACDNLASSDNHTRGLFFGTCEM